MNSKTIILSPNKDTENARGILTIYTEDDLLKCKLRLYSTPTLSPACKLGIYHQKQVYTANLLNRGGQYESSFVGEFNLQQDFYCAIINTAENNSVVLAGGTYSGYYFNNTSVFEEEQEQSEIVEQQINTQPQNCETCEKCANCKYKEFFYSNQVEIKQNIPPAKETPQAEQPKPSAYPSILDSLTPQFKYVLEHYTPNETLNQKIAGGKFVTITEQDKQYSIGAIYEDDKIKYIAYALKCTNNSTPPKEIGDHYQWLPLDTEDPLSDGYFIVFQDAQDLKILEL